jgi:hypothetical protein
MGLKINYGRKMVTKEQTSVNFEYDTLETVLKEVKRLIKDYGKDAKIMMRRTEYSDSDKEYMYLYKDEPETDEAMAKRIADEEECTRRDDERDAAEFKRLQAKFGAK